MQSRAPLDPLLVGGTARASPQRSLNSQHSSRHRRSTTAEAQLAKLEEMLRAHTEQFLVDAREVFSSAEDSIMMNRGMAGFRLPQLPPSPATPPPPSARSSRDRAADVDNTESPTSNERRSKLARA
eukprot:7026577-Prymnesium_polylepis.1